MGLPRDWYTTCSCSFSPWAAQKTKFLKLVFWYCNHLKWPSKVCKACFRPYLSRFSPYLGIRSRGGGGGGPKGYVHNLLMQFFTLSSSKIEVFETCFFWYCDHLKWPSKVCKACFRPYLSRFSPYLGIRSAGRGGGGVPRDWYTTCSCSFSPWAAQKSKFLKLVFFILWSPKMTIQGM